MTARQHEKTALAFAQQRLEQARSNDRALHPLSSAGTALGELLGDGAKAATRYPTTTQVAALERVRSVPRLVRALSRQLHEEFCSGGQLVVLDGGRFGDARCPWCAREQREARFHSAMLAAQIEGRYLDVEWADLELLAPLDRVAQRCAQIDTLVRHGANLLLWGEDTGTGKTQAAMLIGKAAIRAGHSVAVHNMARLALSVRESYRDRSEGALTEEAALKALTAPDLLILDDLGAGESDSAAIERRLLFLALNERQMHRKPTVATTNLALIPPKEAEGKRRGDRAPTLVEVLGARVFARLQPLKTLHVNHGKNFRALPSEVSW